MTDWDDAAFTCGRCPVSFRSADLVTHTVRLDLHEQLHHLEAVLGRVAGLARHQAMAAAVGLTRSIVEGAGPVVTLELEPAYAGAAAA